MTEACLLLIAVAFAVACPLTAVMRRLGARLGAIDRPDERKTHTQPTPTTGGVAIFLAIVTPLLIGLAAAWTLPAELWQRLLPPLVIHLDGIRDQTPMALTLLFAAAALHVTGLLDDRRALGPLTKLAVQAAAALALVGFFNVRLLDLESVRAAAGPLPSVLITVLWFIAITNAFNMLDNMDGLSAGVGAICAGIFMAVALAGGQWFVAALLALLLGALAGFLVFNFPPASIFMGDGGSLVIGFLLAFCSIRVTYYQPESGLHWWAVVTPLIVLAIPLYDLTSVVLVRLRQGRNPLGADTSHFSHRLVARGLSRPAAVAVIWAATLATAISGVMIGRLEDWQAALAIGQTALILLMLAVLELTGRSSNNGPS